MADDRHLVPSATLLPDRLTREEFEALSAELHELRRSYEGELADRLREARTSGSPGDNEDVLAVHAEVSVNAARIVRLQDLLRSAQIVEREFDGCVSVGCTVRVADDDGRTAEYTLIGRRSEESGRREVSPGSPVGKALLGARPGQLVHIEPPGRRARALRILDVSPSGLGAQMPARKGDAEAA